MEIRRVGRADRERLFEIHASTSCRADELEPPEVALLAALDRAEDVLPGLSLAAVVDGVTVGLRRRKPRGGRATRRCSRRPDRRPPAVPERWDRTAVMHTVLEAAEALELPPVGLLGSPAYYARFGFRPATTIDIEPPDSRWATRSRFECSRLSIPTGTFAFAAAFEAVG